MKKLKKLIPLLLLTGIVSIAIIACSDDAPTAPSEEIEESEGKLDENVKVSEDFSWISGSAVNLSVNVSVLGISFETEDDTLLLLDTDNEIIETATISSGQTTFNINISSSDKVVFLYYPKTQNVMEVVLTSEPQTINMVVAWNIGNPDFGLSYLPFW